MVVRGIKMNKKILLLKIILLISFIFLLPYRVYILSFLIFGIFGLLEADRFFGKIINAKEKWHRAPELLNDDKRNYDMLILGYKMPQNKEVYNGLDMTITYSTLYSDFLLMQRYYSLVKKGGTIIFNLPENRLYYKKHRLSIFTLNMLHPVTILEHSKIL